MSKNLWTRCIITSTLLAVAAQLVAFILAHVFELPLAKLLLRILRGQNVAQPITYPVLAALAAVAVAH